MPQRLLLAADLSLYEDGLPGEAPAEAEGEGEDIEAPPLHAAELPYRDSRHVGRVLTVAADGSLTWVLNEPVPSVDATFQGRILAINSLGNAEWQQPIPGGGIIEDEVISSDGTGIGVLYYGTADPSGVVEGALFLATRNAPPEVVPAPPTAAPVLSPVTPPAAQTVDLTWTSVPTATAYEVMVAGTPLLSVVGLTTSITLTVGTHALSVRGLNGGGAGPASNVVSVTVSNQAPPPVTALVPTAITRGAIEVGWAYDLIPPDFQAYIVTATSGTVTVDAPTLSAIVSGLADSTDVTITVKVRDTGGLDSTAVITTARTPDPPPPAAPPTPASLRNTRKGYASLDYAWNAAAGATSYEVSGNGTTWTSVGTALVYLWKSLAENTTYTLRVRARNAGGVSAQASLAVKTLPKVHHYNNVLTTKTYGYGATAWSGLSVGHHSSGVLFTTDNWASAQYLYAFDLSLPSGPYSQQGDRWIRFSIGANVAYINSITGWWGYPGTFRWQAFNGIGVVMQQGAVAAGGGQMGVGPNEKNDTAGGPVKSITLNYTAGLGSPGWYKLQEWQVTLQQITGTTPVYNPA